MRQTFPVVLALTICLAAMPRLRAQAENNAGQPSDNQTQSGTGSPSSANPFPEDTSNVPVMPSKTVPDLRDLDSGAAEAPLLPAPGGDLDPVRSPDDPVPEVSDIQGDGWSSSLQGMDKVLPSGEDDPSKDKQAKGKPAGGKQPPAPVKMPTHQEAASKDIEVGSFYLQTKNWKAAFSRFESALVLDPENPEVYWGLAEAEHHLGEFAKARADYQKLLEYDPTGPHKKQARKALEELAAEAARPSAEAH